MALEHTFPHPVSVSTARLTDLGLLLTRIERDVTSARAILAEIGAASPAVATVPPAGSGPATNARAYVANAAPVGNGYRPVPPPPTQVAKAQAQADMGLRPDFVATAAAIGLGCTPAFVEANLAGVAPTHRDKPGPMCVTCVGMLRRKWEAAQRVTGDATANAAPPTQDASVKANPAIAEAVAATVAPVQDAPPPATFASVLTALIQAGTDPATAVGLCKDATPQGLADMLTALTGPVAAPQAPQTPPQAEAPKAAPQTDKRPYADPTALEANLANIVTPSKAQYVRDVNAARMQGLADPTPPADAKWAADAADVAKLLRRITAASRA